MSPAEALSEIASVLLDLDGCVWIGDELAPGAAELVSYLRDAGIETGFLTNTSWTDPGGVAAKLRRLGVEADAEDVVSPLSVLFSLGALQGDPGVLVLGTEDLAAQISRRGTRVTAQADDADVVVVGLDLGLTYVRLAEAAQALIWGAELVALNLDPNVPAGGGRTRPGAGAIAAALTEASGVEPTLVGKPSRAFFEHALTHFDMDRSTTAMVGDRADVDVRGANAAGLATVLVGAAPGQMPASDVPDASVADLRELLSQLASG